MEDKNRKILESFTLENLPCLDVAVLGALELFQDKLMPRLDVSNYKHPLVVGSGNAEVTGRIIFEDVDAVFASESTYEEKIRYIENIDGVVLISASGEKHAPLIARCSGDLGKHVTLITNNENAAAAEYLDNEHPFDKFVYPKNREPYTYNTSTYMGMILGSTKENPKEIYDYICNEIAHIQFPDFSAYDKFYLIIPSQFAGIKRMLHVKFIELFGRKIARDVETEEYVKHATTIVPSDELFISFGTENKHWGEPKNRLHIPLPTNANYGLMMAVSYFVIGKIQEAQPPYFVEHIEEYLKKASEIFGHEIKPIVE